MKIVAQSIVPPKPTYLHLAYTAASTRSDAYIIAPTVMFIALLIALYQRQFKPKLWKPLLTLGIGVAITAAVAMRPLTYRYPDEVTRYRCQHLLQEISFHYSKGKPIPSSVRKMKNKWKLDDEYIQDAWRHDLRVVNYPQDKELPYRVISAGADGKFATRDDVTYPPKKDHPSPPAN